MTAARSRTCARTSGNWWKATITPNSTGLSELPGRVREIRSVTVGVNLDAQLRPREAGVLAINPEPFRSGDTLQKILHLNFKNDGYTCIADLVPFGKKQNENQKTALSLAFNAAINDVYRQSLRSWIGDQFK